MSEEAPFIAKIIEYLWVPLFGWLQIAYRGHRKEMSDIKDRQHKSEVDLLKYQADAKDNFVNIASFQHTMDRLYSVLEEHRNESRLRTAEMREDIKTIMVRLNGAAH